MFRRTVLAGGLAALSGCTVTPSPPSTDGYPSSPPTFLGAFEWLPDESAYRVTFDGGNRITKRTTERLSVYTVGSETVWASRDAGDDPVAAFPIEPGDSIIHSVEERDAVRVVWQAHDGDSSQAIAVWRQAAQPTPMGTRTPE